MKYGLFLSASLFVMVGALALLAPRSVRISGDDVAPLHIERSISSSETLRMLERSILTTVPTAATGASNSTRTVVLPYANQNVTCVEGSFGMSCTTSTR